jgi:hypothetical protein
MPLTEDFDAYFEDFKERILRPAMDKQAKTAAVSLPPDPPVILTPDLEEKLRLQLGSVKFTVRLQATEKHKEEERHAELLSMWRGGKGILAAYKTRNNRRREVWFNLNPHRWDYCVVDQHGSKLLRNGQEIRKSPTFPGQNFYDVEQFMADWTLSEAK